MIPVERKTWMEKLKSTRISATPLVDELANGLSDRGREYVEGTVDGTRTTRRNLVVSRECFRRALSAAEDSKTARVIKVDFRDPVKPGENRMRLLFKAFYPEGETAKTRDFYSALDAEHAKTVTRPTAVFAKGLECLSKQETRMLRDILERISSNRYPIVMIADEVTSHELEINGKEIPLTAMFTWVGVGLASKEKTGGRADVINREAWRVAKPLLEAANNQLVGSLQLNVYGSPGSGKTTFAEHLVKQLRLQQSTHLGGGIIRFRLFKPLDGDVKELETERVVRPGSIVIVDDARKLTEPAMRKLREEQPILVLCTEQPLPYFLKVNAIDLDSFGK